MRLIDADTLMREFAEFVRRSNNSDFAEIPTWNDAVSLLGAAPTIEPKKGKWIPKTLYPLSFSDGECKDCVQCSNCKTHWDFETNYCPNCGTLMERSEE